MAPIKAASEPKKVQYVTQKLPNGWQRRIYLRTNGASAGRKDVVLITPDTKVLRSNVEIEKYAKAHKMKLDPNVFNVSMKLVENVFKKESEILLAKLASPKTKPSNENNKRLRTDSETNKKERSTGVLTESTPSNVIKKSDAKEEMTPRGRGRPKGSGNKNKLLAIRHKKTVKMSLALQRRKSDSSRVDGKKKPKEVPKKSSEVKAKKRRNSDSGAPKVAEKKSKVESFAVVSSGRQTRNSLSSIEIPILSPKMKNRAMREISPEKLPRGWKVTEVESTGKKTITVTGDKVKIKSLKQLKNYTSKISMPVNLKKFATYFGGKKSDVEGKETAEAEKAEESQEQVVEQENENISEEVPEGNEEDEVANSLDETGAETEVIIFIMKTHFFFFKIS
jgi:hypothetical protein